MGEHEKSPCCAVSRPKSPSPVPLDRRQEGEARQGRTDGMVLISAGEFLMGTDKVCFPRDVEGPVHQVKVGSFYIDVCTVTNAQFAEFVDATGYKSQAERYGWSFVFKGLLPRRTLRRVKEVVAEAPWWCKVDGADWRHPEGPGSDIRDKMSHPVVHVSWYDAIEYCRWAGKRLPTEAEWEYAARGGLVQKLYPWGDDLTPEGRHYCNIWQGRFPNYNTAEDGYVGTAPSISFPSNGYGLYNMSGNVWEWCVDWFSATYYAHVPRDNPKGPPFGSTKLVKGGSYLCHESYCNRYRVAARTSTTPDSSTGHIGFRCVRDV